MAPDPSPDACSRPLRSKPLSSEVVVAGQAFDCLVPTPEDDIASRKLPDHCDGHFDALRQRVEDGARGTDQELVILAPRGRKNLGVTSEGLCELSCIVFDGQEIQVHVAPHPAPVAHMAY